MDYPHDVYPAYRGCSWGWATWKDRWDTVDWSARKYHTKEYEQKYKRKFARGGKDLPGMLVSQMKGEIDSWAVRWMFQQSIDEKYTIYPKKSKVINAGFDGTGTHCGFSDEFDISYQLEKCDVVFENLPIDKKLMRKFKKHVSSSLIKKIRFKVDQLKNQSLGVIMRSFGKSMKEPLK